MYKLISTIVISIALINVVSCQTLKEKMEAAAKQAEEQLKKDQQGGGLSNEEVIEGLKNALTVGTSNGTNLASKVDGFYKNH